MTRGAERAPKKAAKKKSVPPKSGDTIASLRERLETAEQTLEAIRSGSVDALVVAGPNGERVFTLQGADHRYRRIVESMTEGATIVGTDGTIYYANRSFSKLVGVPLDRVLVLAGTERDPRPGHPVGVELVGQLEAVPVVRQALGVDAHPGHPRVVPHGLDERQGAVGDAARTSRPAWIAGGTRRHRRAARPGRAHRDGEARIGEVGHVEDFLIEDADWSIRYMIVDTKNWWPGKRVLVSPHSAKEISWTERLVRVDVDRQRIKASPPYDSSTTVDRAYERQYHAHYAAGETRGT